MADEIKEVTEEPTAQETTSDEPRDISASDVRKHDLFLKQARRAKELEDQLRSFKVRDAERQKELEVTKAQEEGRLKELLAAHEARASETIAQYERRLAEQKLRADAVLRGVTDELAIDGLVHRYSALQPQEGEERPDPTSWLEGLVADERTKHLFERKPVASGTGPSASPSTRARGTKEDFETRLANFDPDALARADELMRQGVPREDWR